VGRREITGLKSRGGGLTTCARKKRAHTCEAKEGSQPVGRREITASGPLPDAAFVYVNFNSYQKIEPELFEVNPRPYILDLKPESRDLSLKIDPKLDPKPATRNPRISTPRP
jgi:predicted O-linked N-acetylglucosamine transferase (SPINDLY family)